MDDPFWTHDTFLFDGTFHYYRDKQQPVRGKLHVSGERYDFNEFGHSLERGLLKTAQGKRIYMLMHPYIIVPNVVMSVALHPRPKQYVDAFEAIGHVTKTKLEGYRDIKIGNAQAWYYPEDNSIVLWECFLDSYVRDAPLGEDKNMLLLWTGFEHWLLDRYPEAKMIVTPWMDPLWQAKEYQTFLRRQGYTRGEPGTFMKLLK
jgi:hypothetical protein